MTPPVLFLDVDGVLNSALYLHNNPGSFDRKDNDWITMLDPLPCALLAGVIRRTGAAVVISSAWRYNHSPAEMKQLLRRRDVDVVVLGRTELGAGHRGAQILRWLAEHPEVTRWAVIDDSGDMDGCFHRFVQTSWSFGMQQEHADLLCEILMGEENSHTTSG